MRYFRVKKGWRRVCVSMFLVAFFGIMAVSVVGILLGGCTREKSEATKREEQWRKGPSPEELEIEKGRNDESKELHYGTKLGCDEKEIEVSCARYVTTTISNAVSSSVVSSQCQIFTPGCALYRAVRDNELYYVYTPGPAPRKVCTAPATNADEETVKCTEWMSGH